MLIAAAEKFIKKVESGRAHSVRIHSIQSETYKELTDALIADEDIHSTPICWHCGQDVCGQCSLRVTRRGRRVRVCNICLDERRVEIQTVEGNA